MFILGLSFYYHDSAAALLHDGLLVAASEEERFSRIKHDHGFPSQAIAFCLQRAGIAGADLDYVVFYEKPLLKFERILMSSLGTFPRSWKTFGEAMITWINDKLWIKELIGRQIGIPPEKILFVEHHLAHAASAFLASPYDSAAILTVDGVGEWTTATMGYGKASWDGGAAEIHLTQEQRFPHSLGLVYSAFTAYLGFRVNNGEYKVMGMSPYGEPRFVDQVYKVLRVGDDGSLRVNMDYFSYHYSSEHTYNQRFVDLFGPARTHTDEFFTIKSHPDADPNSAQARQNQRYADIAASIQWVTEEAILKMARAVHKQTGSERLCMAGGVALNSKANGRILAETPFTELFIQPAAGDDGGALGAALYAHHILLGKPRKFVQEHNYWGAEFDPGAIQQALAEDGYRYERLGDEELAARTVDRLLKGEVVALYQGRAEWGPRALGNRSILADPRRDDMKEVVNSKIKFREPFRPFAPVILESETERFFEGVSNVEGQYPLRFMLSVHPWNPNLGDCVPAVNHLGTGRLQCIRKEWNPRYYDLVERFGQATGVPVLLNTSFNLRGEPIVNAPTDALRTFSGSGIDVLVMENFWVEKAQ